MKNIVLLSLLLIVTLPAQANQRTVAEAAAVMHEFMRTFNARDESAWADTLLFPHVRVASGTVDVIPDKKTFVANRDLDVFAEEFNWSHSQWDHLEAIQIGPDKVHFQVTFTRFNREQQPYATYQSLYVLQKVDGRWGIRLRSSFAP